MNQIKANGFIITEENVNYIMSWMTGGFQDREVSYPVSKELVDKALKSEQDAYEVELFLETGEWVTKESNEAARQNYLGLLLVDPVDWQEEIEAVHLEILQEKLNNYIYFLESKQYVARYGDSFDKKVIHITFQYSPSDNGLAFLAAVQKVLQPTDMSLKVELPE